MNIWPDRIRFVKFSAVMYVFVLCTVLVFGFSVPLPQPMPLSQIGRLPAEDVAQRLADHIASDNERVAVLKTKQEQEIQELASMRGDVQEIKAQHNQMLGAMWTLKILGAIIVGMSSVVQGAMLILQLRTNRQFSDLVSHNNRRTHS